MVLAAAEEGGSVFRVWPAGAARGARLGNYYGALSAGRPIDDGPKPYTYLRLEYVIKTVILISFFGQCPADLGPETPLIGSGSKNGAEITHN